MGQRAIVARYGCGVIAALTMQNAKRALLSTVASSSSSSSSFVLKNTTCSSSNTNKKKKNVNYYNTNTSTTRSNNNNINSIATRNFNFASSQYASCFQDIPTPDVAKLRRDALEYLDSFDKQVWYDDPVS